MTSLSDDTNHGSVRGGILMGVVDDDDDDDDGDRKRPM